MNFRVASRPARALMLVTLMVGGSAWAVLRVANLGLAPGGASCDGKGSYGYIAAWRGGPSAAYQVNSGNQCTLAGKVCGISNAGCNVICSPQGACSAKLGGCLVGRGGAWVKATALDRSVYQQVPAAPPSKCQ
jgi:hypothetical protein